jgi:hypothetical protein
MLFAAPAADTREQRARHVLAMLAFAYLAALSRADFAKASQVLSVFQTYVRQEAPAVAAGFPAAVRERVQAALRSVPQSGMFDAPTREALIAALMVGWRSEPALLNTLPTSASSAAEWYRNKLATQSPAPAMMAADAVVRATEEPDVANTLTMSTSAYLSGRTAGNASSAAGETFQGLLDNLMGRGTPATAGDIVRGEEIDVGQTRAKTPSWVLWGVGIGGAVAVGLLAWGFLGRKS